MTSRQLAGSRVLIVEDEYFLADEAHSILAGVGAEVLGPVATAGEAHAFIEANPDIDGVLLDVNLRGEIAFDVADVLQSRRIPFAFVTGYNPEALPDRFSAVPSLQKPIRAEQLIDLFETLTPTKADRPN